MKEGDKEVSSAELYHFEGEGAVHDPNSECLPLLDL